MKFITELGLAATAVSAQFLGDLSIDLSPVKPFEPVVPTALPIVGSSASGDSLEEALSLLKNLANDVKELKGVAGYIKSIRANLDQGCAYIPDEQKGECVDKCYEEPVTTPAPPTTQPRSQIDPEKVCAAKCIKDKVCAEDDSECLGKCVEKCVNNCAKDEYKCFWQEGDVNGWSDNRDACLTTCFDDPAFKSFIDLETAKTKFGEVKQYEVVNGRWTLETATEWLRPTCLAKGICPADNEGCLKDCGHAYYYTCAANRGYRCFQDDHSTSGHKGDLLDRYVCVDACLEANWKLQTKLANTGRKFQVKYTIEELWELEYFHQRTISENICEEGDEDCLWKVYQTWYATCDKCAFKNEWFAPGAKGRDACFNTCQTKKIVRERLYTIAWQYSQIKRENVRLWTTTSTQKWGRRGRGLWNQWWIRENVVDRCISSNVCQALGEDAKKSDVESQKDCLNKCAIAWSRYCSRGHHSCFSENNEFDGFTNRTACMDSCESETFSLRTEFKLINQHFNSEMTLSLVDYVATDFDRAGKWRFHYIRSFVEDRCVSSNVCDADNSECIDACANAYWSKCGSNSNQCFWNRPNPDEVNEENVNNCLDTCEESNEEFRSKLTEWYTFFNTTGDLDLVEFKKIIKTKVKVTMKIKEYTGDSGLNRWTLRFEDGVQVGDWVRVLGEDDWPLEGWFTYITREVRIQDEVPMIWKRVVKEIEGGEDEIVEDWKQTQGDRKFDSPDDARAWAEEQGYEYSLE